MGDAWVHAAQETAMAFSIDFDAIETDVRALREDIQSLSSQPSPDASVRQVHSTQTPFDGTSIALSPRVIVPPLESFKWGNLTRDSTIEVRKVEENMERAGAQIAACAAIEARYRECARRYVEARLKIEEFLRYDAIHQLEVEAGCDELPFKEAEAERAATAAAIQRYRALLTEVSTLLDSDHGALGSTNLTLMGNAARSLSREAPVANQDLQTSRGQIEQSSFLQAKDSAEAQAAQLSGRLAALAERANYCEKDILFRRMKTATSRDLVFLNFVQMRESGGPLNEREELKHLRAIYSEAFKNAYVFYAASSDGLSRCYHIPNMSVETPTNGQALRALQIWHEKARHQLSLKKRSEVVEVYSLPIVRSATSQNPPIRVRPQDIGGPGKLLRGVAFEYLSDHPSGYVQLDVTPPRAATSDGNGPARTLRFARIPHPTFSGEVRPCFVEECWNGTPEGDWTVRPASGPTQVDMVMHLWLARQ